MFILRFIYYFAVILLSIIPEISSGEALSVHSCLLGDPNSPEWRGRPSGIAGEYFTTGSILFKERPTREWEFVATGTGVTGITVRFPRSMLVQINHAGSIDEMGLWRNLGQLYFDLDGSPFFNSSNFRMEHDLRKSVIRIRAETKTGCVRVEIRAHIELDVGKKSIKYGGSLRRVLR